MTLAFSTTTRTPAAAGASETRATHLVPALAACLQAWTTTSVTPIPAGILRASALPAGRPAARLAVDPVLRLMVRPLTATAFRTAMLLSTAAPTPVLLTTAAAPAVPTTAARTADPGPLRTSARPRFTTRRRCSARPVATGRPMTTTCPRAPLPQGGTAAVAVGQVDLREVRGVRAAARE